MGGEFGNLIAGDARSAPLVQFRLLHSKYHLCSIGTRGLLLTTYVKFINLSPEIKTVLEDMPPFPEKESSGLLNLHKKKRPGRVPENPEIKSSSEEEPKPKLPGVSLETSNNNT